MSRVWLMQQLHNGTKAPDSLSVPSQSLARSFSLQAYHCMVAKGDSPLTHVHLSEKCQSQTRSVWLQNLLKHSYISDGRAPTYLSLVINSAPCDEALLCWPYCFLIMSRSPSSLIKHPTEPHPPLSEAPSMFHRCEPMEAQSRHQESYVESRVRSVRPDSIVHRNVFPNDWKTVQASFCLWNSDQIIKRQRPK